MHRKIPLTSVRMMIERLGPCRAPTSLSGICITTCLACRKPIRSRGARPEHGCKRSTLLNRTRLQEGIGVLLLLRCHIQDIRCANASALGPDVARDQLFTSEGKRPFRFQGDRFDRSDHRVILLVSIIRLPLRLMHPRVTSVFNFSPSAVRVPAHSGHQEEHCVIAQAVSMMKSSRARMRRIALERRDKLREPVKSKMQGREDAPNKYTIHLSPVSFLSPHSGHSAPPPRYSPPAQSPSEQTMF